MMKKLLLILSCIPIYLIAENLGNTNLEIIPKCYSDTSSSNFLKIVPEERYKVSLSKDISLNDANNVLLISSKGLINFTISTKDALYAGAISPSDNPLFIPMNQFSVAWGLISVGTFDQLIKGEDLQLNFTINGKVKEYDIINAKEEWTKSVNNCLEQIEKDRKEIYTKWLVSLVAIIFAIIIAIRIIKALIKISKNKISQGKNKLKEIEKQKEEKRVRKIAEEESIRASVKKSIDESKNDDLEELQNLINKAVEKGDSETAQALLKILNSKQDK